MAWSPDYNRTLKYVFKSAATRASCRGPLKPFYESWLAKGSAPAMARLTVGRKIAAIAFTLWKQGERFDSKKLTKSTR